jgi:hypothetical protein
MEAVGSTMKNNEVRAKVVPCGSAQPAALAEGEWRNLDSERLRRKAAATRVTLEVLAKAQVVCRETLKRRVSI